MSMNDVSNRPSPSEMLANLKPSVNVYDDWSKAKPREECQPFTSQFFPTTDPRSVKQQSAIQKKLTTLLARQAREAKKRAKVAA